MVEQAIPTTVDLIKVGLIADVIALAEEQVTSASSFEHCFASSLRNPYQLPNWLALPGWIVLVNRFAQQVPKFMIATLAMNRGLVRMTWTRSGEWSNSP